MSACITKTNNKLVVFSENKSKFEVVNKHGRDLERHSVDGCLIVKGERCDFKLVDVDTKREVYIELKGSDVQHAVSQILTSVDALAGSKSDAKTAYIICTRNPLSSTAVAILVKKVRQSHNVILRVKKTIYSASAEEVFNI